MKKLLTSISIFLILFSSAYADRISYSQAEKYAKGVFATAQNMLPSQIRLSSVKPVFEKASLTSAGSQEDAEPNYYIFNNESGKGFIIISADNVARPVLAYSDESSFKDGPLPENIQAWFLQLDDQFDYLRENNCTASNEGLDEWNDLIRGASASPTGQKVLKTANWDQSNPYNLVIPEGCVTGCVQTAIAILMKYYKYPDGPKKTYTRTIKVNNKDKSVTVEAQNNKYDWDAMSDEYDEYKTYTIENNPDAFNVSQLMYDLGVMQEADYTTSSTGAFSSSISMNMAELFGYSKNAIRKERDYYSRDEWTKILRDEIDKKRPLVYSGSTGTGGHCFICDGYADDYYFHINWGWGGYCNAWFALDAFQPSGQGTGGSGGSAYSKYQDVQIGLIPDPDGSIEREVEYIITMDNLEIYSDKNKEVSKGDNVTLSATNWRNESQAKLEFEYGAYESYNKKTHAGGNISIQHGYGYSSISVTAESLGRVHLGDYVTIYFKPKGEGVKFSTFNSDNIRGIVPLIDAAYIVCDKTTFNSGDIFEKNLFYGRSIPAAVVWTYDDKVKTGDIVLTAGKHTVKAILTYSDKSTETVVKEIDVK